MHTLNILNERVTFKVANNEKMGMPNFERNFLAPIPLKAWRVQTTKKIKDSVVILI